MQPAIIASARGRSGRHLRYTAIVTALILVNAWIWSRLLFGLVSNSANLSAETIVAAAAATVALLTVIALWHQPLNRNVAAMATPALRHSLATHQAGHLAAAYLEDPSRIGRASVAEPCAHTPGEVPAVTQTALRTELVVTLAGLSAEEIFAGESGSHAATDLVRATTIGADMAGRFGMTGSLVSLATSRTKRTKYIDKVLADARTRKELEALLRDSKRDSMRVILENRHLVIALRDALMRRDTMTGPELFEVLEKAEQARNNGDQVLVDLRTAADRPRPLVSATDL